MNGDEDNTAYARMCAMFTLAAFALMAVIAAAAVTIAVLVIP